MKAIFTTLLLLSVFGSANSQVDKRLSLGIHFQKDNPFEQVGGVNSVGNLFCYTPMVIYAQPFLFTTGITLNYGISKNIEFTTGAQFYREEQNYIYYGGCFCENCDTPIEPKFSNNKLEIPLKARIYLLPGKFKLHFDAGQNVGLRLNAIHSHIPITFSMLSGFGCDYFINRMQFSISANYERQFHREGLVNPYFKNNIGIELKTTLMLNQK